MSATLYSIYEAHSFWLKSLQKFLCWMNFFPLWVCFILPSLLMTFRLLVPSKYSQNCFIVMGWNCFLSSVSSVHLRFFIPWNFTSSSWMCLVFFFASSPSLSLTLLNNKLISTFLRLQHKGKLINFHLLRQKKIRKLFSKNGAWRRKAKKNSKEWINIDLTSYE